jgi:Acyl-CoA hydrolase
MSKAPLPNKTPALRVVPMPSEINDRGTIFGGWLMSQMDLACFTKAVKCTRGWVTTVAANSVVFESPVFVGDVVNIYVDIIRIGTTSLTLGLEVYSERLNENMESYRVARGEMVFVAIDENYKPRPIPPENE